MVVRSQRLLIEYTSVKRPVRPLIEYISSSEDSASEEDPDDIIDHPSDEDYVGKPVKIRRKAIILSRKLRRRSELSSDDEHESSKKFKYDKLCETPEYVESESSLVLLDITCLCGQHKERWYTNDV